MLCRNLYICLAIQIWFILHLSGVRVWLMPPVHSRTAVLPFPPKLLQWHHMEMMHLVMLHETFRIMEKSMSARNPHSAYEVDRRVALQLEVQILYYFSFKRKSIGRTEKYNIDYPHWREHSRLGSKPSLSISLLRGKNIWHFAGSSCSALHKTGPHDCLNFQFCSQDTSFPITF